MDELPEVTTELNIELMPTFRVFKAGIRVGELVGEYADQLEELIQKNSTWPEAIVDDLWLFGWSDFYFAYFWIINY